MPRAVVQVEGARQLRATLRNAGHELTDLRHANATAAETVADAARPETPRRSGRLASTVRSSGTTTGAIIRAGYASVPYAPVIHWGWPDRGIEPHPWLLKTAERTQDQWTADYQQAVERILHLVRGI